MKSFKIVLAVIIAFGLIWFFFGKKNEEVAKPQGDKNHISLNAPSDALLESNALPAEPKPQMTPVPQPQTVPSPIVKVSPAPQTNTNGTNASNEPDRFRKIVTIKEYDPNNLQPARTNSPAGKYYKRFESKLVLGYWDGTNTFTPIDPPQTIDISKSYPISLPYGELLTPDDIKRAGEKKRYTDSEGKTWEEWYDATERTMKSRLVPNP